MALRIGMLGCATTAEFSMFQAIGQGAPIAVTAIAARDPARAQAYAAHWGIAEVYPDYDTLLARADIDAVYIPLANALHHRWTLAALAAGHHVLCEKPLALDAAQAEEMVAAAEARDLVLMEAFHWRAHPLARRIEEMVAEGAIGEIKHIDCWFESSFEYILPNDIRLSPELGGGMLLDMGGYCVNFVRMIAGDDISVVSAHARPMGKVEGAVTAELLLANGATARIHVETDRSGHSVSSGARIEGDRGVLLVDNPFLPDFQDGPEWSGRITLQIDGDVAVEEPGGFCTYYYQAKAFADLVRSASAVPSPARDGIANMRVLDAIREAARLPAVAV